MAKILGVISVWRSISHCPRQSIAPKMTAAMAHESGQAAGLYRPAEHDML
ncbi:MAG: hypothetical protein V7K98_22895 [Nostoc sp.]